MPTLEQDPTQTPDEAAFQAWLRQQSKPQTGMASLRVPVAQPKPQAAAATDDDADFQAWLKEQANPPMGMAAARTPPASPVRGTAPTSGEPAVAAPEPLPAPRRGISDRIADFLGEHNLSPIPSPSTINPIGSVYSRPAGPQLQMPPSEQPDRQKVDQATAERQAIDARALANRGRPATDATSTQGAQFLPVGDKVESVAEFERGRAKNQADVRSEQSNRSTAKYWRDVADKGDQLAVELNAQGDHEGAAEARRKAQNARIIADNKAASEPYIAKVGAAFLGPIGDPLKEAHANIAAGDAASFSPDEQRAQLGMPGATAQRAPGLEDISAQLVGALPWYAAGGAIGRTMAGGAEAVLASRAPRLANAIGKLAGMTPEVKAVTSTGPLTLSRISEEMAALAQQIPRGITEGQTVGAMITYREAREQGATPTEAAQAVVDQIGPNAMFGVAAETGIGLGGRAARLTYDPIGRVFVRPAVAAIRKRIGLDIALPGGETGRVLPDPTGISTTEEGRSQLGDLLGTFADARRRERETGLAETFAEPAWPQGEQQGPQPSRIQIQPTYNTREARDNQPLRTARDLVDESNAFTQMHQAQREAEAAAESERLAQQSPTARLEQAAAAAPEKKQGPLTLAQTLARAGREANQQGGLSGRAAIALAAAPLTMGQSEDTSDQETLWRGRLAAVMLSIGGEDLVKKFYTSLRGEPKTEARPIIKRLFEQQGFKGIELSRFLHDAFHTETGLPKVDPNLTPKVDETLGRKIADLYENATSDPSDPKVREAYRAFVEQTRKQYDFLQQHGIKFEHVDEDPYSNSAEMMLDIHENGRLKSLRTPRDERGFHPLLTPEDNDMFRAVHDFFGHSVNGNQFGATGEENAYRTHAVMYDDIARRAMATETRGQNSWVNFGPHAEWNTENPKDTKFADQKVFVLPDDVINEGIGRANELPSYARSSEGVGAGFDPSLITKLGANMYKGDLGVVALKEGVQNAIDSVRQAGGGDVTVHFDRDDKKLIIEDEGVGMTPQLMESAFVDIGGSGKDALESSGGYGLAKVALFAKSQDIHVESVAKEGDGYVVTTLDGTGDDWINQRMHLDTQHFDTLPDVYHTGTRMELTFQPDVEAEAYQMADWAHKFAKYSQLEHEVKTQIGGYEHNTGDERIKLSQDTPLQSFDVPGATVDTYESEARKDPTGWDSRRLDVHVLNRGVYQFTKVHYLNSGEGLPQDVIVNVHPTVGIDDPDYPFTTSREELKKGAQEILDNIIKETGNRAAIQEVNQMHEALDNAPPMVKDGKATPYVILADKPGFDRDALDLVRHDPHLIELAQVAHSIVAAMHGLVRRDIPKAKFGGLGVSEGWLGLNVGRRKLADMTQAVRGTSQPDRPNEIYWNPFVTHREVTRSMALEGVNDEVQSIELPGRMAEQAWATLLHEVAHQAARGHDENFAGFLTRIEGDLTRHSGAWIDRMEREFRDALEQGNYTNIQAVIEDAWKKDRKGDGDRGAGVLGKIADTQGPDRAGRAGGGHAAGGDAGQLEPDDRGLATGAPERGIPVRAGAGDRGGEIQRPVTGRAAPPVEPIGLATEDLPYRARTPNVGWERQDLQDTARRVTAESVRKDYGKPGDAVYTAWIPIEDMPSPELAEEHPDVAGEEDAPTYDWSEFDKRATFPPAKVRITPEGKYEIMDGNHRTQFWEQAGFDHVPAWVIDERKGATSERPDPYADEHEPGAEFHAFPIGKALKQVAKYPSAAAIGALGAAASQSDDENIRDAGPYVIGLAALSAIGSKRLVSIKDKAVSTLFNQLKKTATGRGLGEFMNPDKMIAPAALDAILTREREAAKGPARASKVARDLERLGPQGDRAVTDVLDKEDWEGKAAQTAKVLTMAAAAEKELTESAHAAVATGARTPDYFLNDYSGKRVYAYHEAQAALAGEKAPGASGGNARISNAKRRTLDIPVNEARQALHEATVSGDPKAIAAAQDALDEAMVENYSRRTELGEIRESSRRVPEAIRQNYIDAANAKALTTLRTIPDVVHPDWADAFDDLQAAKQMAKTATTKADKDAAKVLLDDATVRMHDVSREAAREGSGYVQMPDTKSWGALRGAVVKKVVAHELKGFEPGTALPAKLLTAWKSIKTKFNPGTNVGNILSNVGWAHIKGLPIWDQLLPVVTTKGIKEPYLVRAAKAMQSYGPGAKDLAEVGKIGVGNASEQGGGLTLGERRTTEGLESLVNTTRPETADILRKQGFDAASIAARRRLALAKRVAGGAALGAAKGYGSDADTEDAVYGAAVGGLVGALLNGKVRRAITKTYGSEDDIFRVALWLKRVDGGMSPAAATKSIADAPSSFGMGRSRSPAINLLANTVSPFIRWTANALPEFANDVVDHPWRYLTLLAGMAAVDEYSRKDEGAIPDKDVPIGQRRHAGYALPGLTQLPFSDEQGGKAAVDVSRWTPLNALTQAAPPGTVSTAIGGEATPAIFQPGGPYVDFAARFGANVDPWSGKVNLQRDYPERENIGKMLGEVAGTALPSFLDIHADRLREDVANRDFTKLSNDALGPTGLKPRFIRPGQNVVSATFELKESLRQMKHQLSLDLRNNKNPSRVQTLIERYQGRVQQAAENYRKRIGAPPPATVIHDALTPTPDEE